MNARYGDFMRPLDVDAIGLSQDERGDPLVVRFIQLADAVRRKEMISFPADWTLSQRAAYRLGDYVGFSRLRGYSEDEIREFVEYMAVARTMDENYGPDAASALVFRLHELTGPDMAADGVTPLADTEGP